MTAFRAAATAILLTAAAAAQQSVSFPTQDGGLIDAVIYGKGARGVVLAHGGRFYKESWDTEAKSLAAAGYLLASDVPKLVQRGAAEWDYLQP